MTGMCGLYRTMQGRCLAFVLVRDDGRFYCRRSLKSGRTLTAWSIAGAMIFNHTDDVVAALKMLGRRYGIRVLSLVDDGGFPAGETMEAVRAAIHEIRSEVQ